MYCVRPYYWLYLLDARRYKEREMATVRASLKKHTYQQSDQTEPQQTSYTAS